MSGGCLPFFLATLVGFSAGCTQSASDLPSPPAIPDALPLPPGASDISNRAFPKPLSVADAEQILLLTEFFQYGRPSRQVQAYNVVFDQPDAPARFRALAGRARWAGQLYSLCALTILEAAEAERPRQRLSTVDAHILAYEGDWGGERRVAELDSPSRRTKL